MDRELIFEAATYRVVLEKSEGPTAGRIDEREIAAVITRPAPHGVTVEIGGRRHRAWVARTDEKVFVHLGGRVYEFEEAGARDAVSAGAAGLGGDSVSSLMPGKVVKILVAVGDEVKEGQSLVIVEAMKMETPLAAPAAGTVKKVNFAEGDLVDAGKPIVQLDVGEEE
ncbi:MAG: biotin/lipoyl-containing protein [Candidatus Eisenbacteria bacterium]